MSDSLCGNDTVIIDSRVIVDSADGDYVKIDFPNDLVAVKVGKNGNVLVAENAAGKLSNVTIRLVVGSNDDKYLNSRLVEQSNDLPSFLALNATFAKRVGDGSGKVSNVLYQCSMGTIKKNPGMASNAEGATDSSIVIYEIVFGHITRSIA